MHTLPWPGLLIVASAVLVVTAAAWLPVTQHRVISYGTDAFRAHYPLFGTRSRAQTIALQGRLTGVGALLVNLHRTPQVPPATITITDLKDTPLTSTIVAPEAIKDDTVAWAALPRAVSSRQFPSIKVHVAAPEATVSTALGLRYDDPTGTLAVGVIERVPLWQYLITAVVTSTSLLRLFTLGIVISVCIVLLSCVPAKPTWARVAVFSLLVIVALGTRVYAANHLYGVSGGDSYNYLFITREITELKNPLATSKRLPGFPLLLVPAYLTALDDIRFMEGLSIVSAGGILLMLALIARTVGLPWSVQFLAPTLLAFQMISFGPRCDQNRIPSTPFFFYSPSGSFYISRTRGRSGSWD